MHNAYPAINGGCDRKHMDHAQLLVAVELGLHLRNILLYASASRSERTWMPPTVMVIGVEALYIVGITVISMSASDRLVSAQIYVNLPASLANG
jgi:hypothetical protein